MSSSKPSPLTGLTDEERAAWRAEARGELWRRGDTRHLLHADQRRIHDAITANQRRGGAGRWTQVLLEIARKWGKTWWLLAWFAEQCIRHPGERFVFGAPTYNQLREFAFPIMRELEDLAPPEVRPRFNENDFHWRFPNGAWLHLFACDDIAAAKRGRGPKARAGAFDEAGHVPTAVLEYVLTQVFRPSLMLSDEPLLLLSSTPADEPDHHFTRLAEVAEAEGSYFHATVYDNPMLTAERVERMLAENARDEGLSVEDYRKTPGFRREYLAERAIDTRLVVVPEWAAKRATLMAPPPPRPEFFNGFTWLDFGGADPHAAQFAYWDFARAKVVVEDELLLREGQNTAELSQDIKAKEKALWGVAKWDGALRAGLEDPAESLTANLPDWLADILVKEAPEQPFARWADNDLQLCRDLVELHGLAFIPTAKDSKELQVNNLRLLINADQYLLHPRCVHSDRHLRQTTWKDHKRRDFRRTAAGEHGDLVDTSTYGVRNLDRRNPFPPGYGEPVRSTVGHRLRQAAAEAEKDFGAQLLGGTPLGRKLLAAAARRRR